MSVVAGNIKRIQDMDVRGKRVLLRCDLNVPFASGRIQDEFRLQQSVGTIQYLAGRGAKCIIAAHFDRPKPIFQVGEPRPSSARKGPEFTLAPLAVRLGELAGKNIRFFASPIGEEIHNQIDRMREGDVAMLENIRFYGGEERNNSEFAQALASLGDIYVNDAFGTCHRAHASIAGVPAYLPSSAGLLLQKETAILEKVRERPEKPLAVIVGGTKVETKAAFLQHISKQASFILLGDIITKEVKEKGLQVAETAELVFATDGVDGDYDLGPKTVERFQEKIAQAKTVFWAGPLGKIEEERYEKGSLAIAQTVLQSGAEAVAGGGDLAAFLGKHKLREKFDHVSTGGSAMLAFLAGEELPGLKALGQ